MQRELRGRAEEVPMDQTVRLKEIQAANPDVEVKFPGASLAGRAPFVATIVTGHEPVVVEEADLRSFCDQLEEALAARDGGRQLPAGFGGPDIVALGAEFPHWTIRGEGPYTATPPDGTPALEGQSPESLRGMMQRYDAAAAGGNRRSEASRR